MISLIPTANKFVLKVYTLPPVDLESKNWFIKFICIISEIWKYYVLQENSPFYLMDVRGMDVVCMYQWYFGYLYMYMVMLCWLLNSVHLMDCFPVLLCKRKKTTNVIHCRIYLGINICIRRIIIKWWFVGCYINWTWLLCYM